MRLNKTSLIVIVSAAMVSVFFSATIISFPGFLSFWKNTSKTTSCSQYSKETRVITVTCSSTLSEVHNAVSDDKILKKESVDGVWFLNSSIMVMKGAVLTISPAEARWLKISSEGRPFGNTETNSYLIEVFGALDVYGVKITSWNPKTSNYTYQRADGSIPRPSITVQDGADPSHISNSEIAYLGYNSSRRHGLSFYGGDHSILSGNRIHDLWYGFFSTTVGHLIIENNNVYNNIRYGVDPHKDSHDFVVRGNQIYNSRIGIICSLKCSNVVFENNKVERNKETGIMFSRNTINSTARFNNVSLSDTGISISDSQFNKVYQNTLSSNNFGLAVKDNSSDNLLLKNKVSGPIVCGIWVVLDSHNNTITENHILNYKQSGICLTKANLNTFDSNIIEGPGKYGIDVRNQAVGNSFSDNRINLAGSAIRMYNNTGTLFVNNKVANTNGHPYLVSGNSTLNLVNTTFLGDRIRAAGVDTNTVKIWNSGILDVSHHVSRHAQNNSDIATYNTDAEPYVEKLSYATIYLHSRIK